MSNYQLSINTKSLLNLENETLLSKIYKFSNFQIFKFIFLLFFCSSSLFSQKKIGNTYIGELHSHDTLTFRRVFLNTRVYQDGSWLSNKKIRELYKDTWQPKVKFRWANYQKPIAPIVTLGGIYLVYDGIKGVPASAIIDGKEYPYTIRSLPKVLGGLATFALGICMIESSNELIQHSVEIYNSHQKSSKKTTVIDKVRFGITPNSNFGFVMKIK